MSTNKQYKKKNNNKGWLIMRGGGYSMTIFKGTGKVANVAKVKEVIE